jgi:thiamine-monophosphate kinase
VELNDLGEFGFLRRVREWIPDAPLDDDAAVLLPSPGASLVATTDILVEGLHFRTDWSSAADIGYKAAAVNISDLAAMGARPRWLLVALGVPASTEIAFLEELYAGLGESGIQIVGGDTVASDRLELAVTALGELDGPPLTRAGARPGDVLAVTGPLGRAAAGVNLLLGPRYDGIRPEDVMSCLDAHRRPQARVIEGAALRRAGAHAALDVSDGLASDVRRMCESSGVGADIDVVPVADDARRVADARGWDAQRLALAGGEDYELLVAIPGGFECPVALIEIGRIVDGGLSLRGEPMPEGGWEHFRVGSGK